MKNFIPY